jgi:hypothetical protein
MTTDIEPTPAAARQLTDRIKVAVEGTWLLIQEAYTTRAWAALGYAAWDEYCTAEFGTARLRLPREERQEVVASLRESGLSTRAIASATGVSQMQVSRDLRSTGEPNVSPVIGTDGKTYATTRPAPEPDPFDGSDWLVPGADEIPGQSHVLEHTTPETITPRVERRRPLPEAFADAGRDLARTAERLARLTEDDRFTRNRDQTHHQMPELLGALEHTTRLVQAMNLADAQASEEARRWWATSLHTISDALAGIAQSLTKEN